MKLKETFTNRPVDQHIGGWDELWKTEVTPWDRAGPSLALKDAVTGHADLFHSPLTGPNSRKRALVPGCGRGYDVQLLASLGYDCFGVDGSESAIAAARKLESEVGSGGHGDLYATNDSDIGRGEATLVVGDFFKDDFVQETNGKDFDLIFDYTFLCALPPDLRPKWAGRMSELLSPSGLLVCLEWPLQKRPVEGGPPHGLTSNLYVELFNRPGEAVEYDQEGKVCSSEHEQKRPDNALERIMHLMPSRTHEAGKGNDYVSVWRHWKQ
jgi:SAM-dependent methyltransferase